MNKTVRAIITRKDLYSKDYNEVQREVSECSSRNNIKSGLVELILKIHKELK